jgi:hypothetical protein
MMEAYPQCLLHAFVINTGGYRNPPGSLTSKHFETITRLPDFVSREKYDLTTEMKEALTEVSRVTLSLDSA